MDLLIRGAVLDGRARDIGVEGGRIAWIADDGARPAGGADAARVVDGHGLYAFPGLRNGHTHAAMTLFRGYGDDLPLMEWLRTRIWPAEALLTEEDVYHGTRLAIVEMISSGTVWFNDMYWHRDGVVRAVEELGVRAHVGSVFIDHGDPSGRGAGAMRDAVLRQVEERAALDPRVRVALAPHAIYTVAPKSLAWLGALAAEHDLVLHIHLSETRPEVEACVAEHGVRPAFFLDRLGLLGPNLVVAHGVYLDAEEMGLLADAGATVVTNPTANMKLATGGIFDYRGAVAAGLRVALGTDGAGSNNNLDMIEEMKTLALVQKHRAADPTALTARDALSLATTAPAEAFRLGSGRLEVGAPADLILVDFSHPSIQPVHDATSALVYAANGRAVHTTVCAGRVLLHDGVLEVASEAEIVTAAVAAAEALAERANTSRPTVGGH
jgi:5-methylthioadenosine/S-adenosylhomocysteine deaminase